jgi:hypothetical protein
MVDSALPGLYQGADDLSLRQQRRFLFASRLRLVLVVCAAVGGAFGKPAGWQVDPAALATVVALVGAVVTEMWLLVEKPEKGWYEGRALAESAKTLAWRFAACAAPFPREEASDGAEARLVREMQELLRDAPDTAVVATGAPAVSPEMRALRNADLHTRRDAYLQHRIDNQAGWYRRKARWNIDRAQHWRIGLLVMETLGVIAALVRAVGLVEIDLAGIVAALIGAGVAWLATKQHENVGRAYAFATNELGLARARLEGISDEQRWAQEVADAEEAISREHTMWRASRTSH